MGLIFVSSFVFTSIFAAIVAATSTVFYQGKQIEDLNFHKLKVLNGSARISNRIFLFFHFFIFSYSKLSIYLIAGVITLIIWLLQ